MLYNVKMGPTCWMITNVLVTVVDIVANVLSFGATSPLDPSGSTGVQKLRVGGIASPPAATFSIWGIIFFWQFAFLFAQFGCCCSVNKTDVMKVTPYMIAAQLAQAAYGLTIYLIPEEEKGALLWVASLVITVAFAAFLYLSWILKDYSPRNNQIMFWLTFGYTVNAGWLVVATYVQWSSLFVYQDLNMNALQIPFLIFTALVYGVISLAPAFKFPPAYFCVALWTFSFQALLWSPQPGASEHFTEEVQHAYRIICAVLAVVSLAGTAYVWYKKCAESKSGDENALEGSSAEEGSSVEEGDTQE